MLPQPWFQLFPLISEVRPDLDMSHFAAMGQRLAAEGYRRQMDYIATLCESAIRLLM